jgi:hypothetical protein
MAEAGTGELVFSSHTSLPRTGGVAGAVRVTRLVRLGAADVYPTALIF